MGFHCIQTFIFMLVSLNMTEILLKGLSKTQYDWNIRPQYLTKYQSIWYWKLFTNVLKMWPLNCLNPFSAKKDRQQNVHMYICKFSKHVSQSKLYHTEASKTRGQTENSQMRWLSNHPKHSSYLELWLVSSPQLFPLCKHFIQLSKQEMAFQILQAFIQRFNPLGIKKAEIALILIFCAMQCFPQTTY